MSAAATWVRPAAVGLGLVAVIAAHHGLTAAALTGRSRVRAVVAVRALAAWVLYQRTLQLRAATGSGWAGLSTTGIGALLGGRDHSTVLNLLARAEAYRQADPEYRALADLLAKRVSPGLAPICPAPPRQPAVVLRQVKPKNELSDDDSDALDRRRGTERLLAAIMIAHGERCALLAAQAAA